MLARLSGFPLIQQGGDLPTFSKQDLYGIYGADAAHVWAVGWAGADSGSGFRLSLV